MDTQHIFVNSDLFPHIAPHWFTYVGVPICQLSTGIYGHLLQLEHCARNTICITYGSFSVQNLKFLTIVVLELWPNIGLYMDSIGYQWNTKIVFPDFSEPSFRRSIKGYFCPIWSFYHFWMSIGTQKTKRWMLHRVKKVPQYGPQWWNEVHIAMALEESNLEPEASCPISSVTLVFHLEQSLNLLKVKKVEYGISRGWIVQG